jgi:hypothetical protein
MFHLNSNPRPLYGSNARPYEFYISRMTRHLTESTDESSVLANCLAVVQYYETVMHRRTSEETKGKQEINC